MTFALTAVKLPEVHRKHVFFYPSGHPKTESEWEAERQ